MPVRDIDIRVFLAARLREQFADEPGTLILHELGVSAGICRVDIAVINGQLHGFEIKSEFDTLKRLPSQAMAYNAVFDYMTIVLGATHIEKAKALLPSWWGIITISGQLKMRVLRKARRNSAPSPLEVARLLWRDEALSFLALHNASGGFRSKSRNFLYQHIAENFSFQEISSFVRATLKARANWRSDALRIPDGDSSPLGAKL